MPNIVLLALLAVLTAGAAGAVEGEFHEIRTSPGRLPYRFVPSTAALIPLVADEMWLTNTLVVDVDGDGYPERIAVGNPGVDCQDMNPTGGIGNVWWYNVPPEFAWRRPCGSIDGVWDVSDNGEPEAVILLRTEDRSRWRIERLHAATGRFVAAHELTGGADLRPDGHWDGFYKVVGCIDSPRGETTRRVLLVAASSGYDEQPRGVIAIDAAADTVLWEYRVGPKPEIRSFHVMDLDGDGRPEICFAGSGVNNLDGKLFNGTTDDRAMLFVLRDDGTLAWSYGTPPGTAGLHFDIADAGGDGKREIFLGESLERSDTNRFRVLDCCGSVIAESPDGFVRGRSLFAAPAGDGSVTVALIDGRYDLIRYSFDGETLRRTAGARFATPGVRIGLLADLAPEPGLEILAGDDDWNLWLLDADLEPLALLPTADCPVTPHRVILMRPPDGPPTVALTSEAARARVRVHVERSPHAFPVVPVAATVAVLLAATGAAWLRRQRPAPASIRELRIQLLGRLKLANHGKIGALSALRRLIWLHETHSQGFGLAGEPRDVYRTLGTELLTAGLPGLAGALDLAAMAQLDGELVARARDTIEELERALSRLADAGWDDTALADMAESLGAAATTAEAAFQTLRRSVEDSFVCDPREILERSLAAHAVVVRANRVTVELPDGAAPACRADAEEMTFVLDNLIENALRAMADSAAPRLAIGWEKDEDGNEVVILISDTGCGIIPDDWGRIFEPGFSQRRGGGLGLPGSREIMRKYGGSLTVRSSSPGSGTTFQVRCPAAG